MYARPLSLVSCAKVSKPKQSTSRGFFDHWVFERLEIPTNLVLKRFLGICFFQVALTFGAKYLK